MVTWGKKQYETGVEKVALYVCNEDGEYGDGVAWDGVTNITEKPSGAEVTAIYADNEKYLNLMSREDFAASIEAYTYPDEFGECDGSVDVVAGMKAYAQPRKHFGLSYVTLVGTEKAGTDAGYKLHLIYDCLAAPSERAYATVNESTEAMTFSWELSTTPVEVPGHKKSALITLDSTVLGEKIKKVEEYLYGTESVEGKFPTPAKIKELLTQA